MATAGPTQQVHSLQAKLQSLEGTYRGCYRDLGLRVQGFGFRVLEVPEQSWYSAGTRAMLVF